MVACSQSTGLQTTSTEIGDPMAVALKSRVFNSSNELVAFCQLVANNVTSIVEIIYSLDGKYILFYL